MITNLLTRKQFTEQFLPAGLRNKTLDTFPAGTSGRQEAVHAVTGYVDDIISGTFYPLVIYGPQGTGKTGLICSAWNGIAPRTPDRSDFEDVRKAGTADNLAFVRGDELVDHLRSGTADNRVEQDQKRYHLETCFLCVLDDLDKAPAGNWSSAIFGLVDERVWTRQLPTMVTMNTTPAEFAVKYGEAGLSIISRFQRAGALFIRLDELGNTGQESIIPETAVAG